MESEPEASDFSGETSSSFEFSLSNSANSNEEELISVDSTVELSSSLTVTALRTRWTRKAMSEYVLESEPEASDFSGDTSSSFEFSLSNSANLNEEELISVDSTVELSSSLSVTALRTRWTRKAMSEYVLESEPEASDFSGETSSSFEFSLSNSANSNEEELISVDSTVELSSSLSVTALRTRWTRKAMSEYVLESEPEASDFSGETSSSFEFSLSNSANSNEEELISVDSTVELSSSLSVTALRTRWTRKAMSEYVLESEPEASDFSGDTSSSFEFSLIHNNNTAIYIYTCIIILSS